MFRLCYGLVTACEWDPRAPTPPLSIIKDVCVCVCCEGQRLSYEWHQALTLLLTPPALPTHLIILNQDNIRHALHGAQVRGSCH